MLLTALWPCIVKMNEIGQFWNFDLYWALNSCLDLTFGNIELKCGIHATNGTLTLHNENEQNWTILELLTYTGNWIHVLTLPLEILSSKVAYMLLMVLWPCLLKMNKIGQFWIFGLFWDLNSGLDLTFGKIELKCGIHATNGTLTLHIENEQNWIILKFWLLLGIELMPCPFLWEYWAQMWHTCY